MENHLNHWKLFLLFKNNDPLVFQGVEGQKKVAKEIFKGNTKRTYRQCFCTERTFIGKFGGF